ncbi:MAG: hypothetical protein H0W24_05045 [Lysobacter sp.]|jgi:hypothetical protein|nr:hypothetical protein [Lysobacter sp.]MDQ3268950.1 hypothetical protein [Pseudomonadota bacterium]
MSSDFQLSLHELPAGEVAEELRMRKNLEMQDLQAALANVYDRIAKLEQTGRLHL